MSVEIKKVSSKKELKQFIRFNYEFYKDNPYSVPDLYEDIRDTFDPKENAALEFCDADYFMAFKDGKIISLRLFIFISGKDVEPIKLEYKSCLNTSPL